MNVIKQSAKEMAKEEMKEMPNEVIDMYAKEEKKRSLIFYVLILLCSVVILACGIVGFTIPNGGYIIGIFCLSLFVIYLIFIIWKILVDKKKTNKDLVFERLERKYLKKPKLIKNEIISNQLEMVNKYREIVIPKGLFSKNKILINNDQKTISFDINNFKTKEYKFDEIIKYELSENGNSVVKGSAGKALVGGLFFGLGGAIIGSSMSRKVNNKCSQLSIIVFLNDQNRPYITIPIITIETDKSNLEYKNAVSLAQEICGILEFAINQRTLQSYSNNSNIEMSSKEQLKELKEMLEENLITQEEYETKKKQILGL